MPSLYTEIEINACRRDVWRVLIHKENWRYWNTFLYDCDARQPLESGREVSLSMRRLPGEEETEFQPLVTLLQPGICLRWRSSIPGFNSEHTFELQEIGPNQTKYFHQETFSGALTRLFFPFIRRDEQQGMRRMAWELKQYTETKMRL